MSITIIDYGVGNVGSIKNMFKKIGFEAEITSEPENIKKAKKLVLPGVGSFDHGMKMLTASGFLEILNEKVLNEKVPVLGICLGMQLMGKGSEEGSTPGLGWVNAFSRKFVFPQDNTLKVPHMGWNNIKSLPESTLFKHLEENARFYFVHSFHVVCELQEDVAASAAYGLQFTCSFTHHNIYGVQFHPEKSHKFGMTLFKNFAEL